MPRFLPVLVILCLPIIISYIMSMGSYFFTVPVKSVLDFKMEKGNWSVGNIWIGHFTCLLNNMTKTSFSLTSSWTQFSIRQVMIILYMQKGCHKNDMQYYPGLACVVLNVIFAEHVLKKRTFTEFHDECMICFLLHRFKRLVYMQSCIKNVRIFLLLNLPFSLFVF